jgi:hypothetical protein
MRRVVHLRVATRTGDHRELGAFLKEAIPYYESVPGVRVRLLRSMEHPDRYIEAIEYETIEAFESDEKRLGGDPRMQGFIQRWRTLLRDDVAIETYEELTDTI